MILVDSDILIHALRGNQAAQDWMRVARARDTLGISAVSVTEVTGGMRSEERRSTMALLSTLRTEPVTDEIGRRAGELMRTYRRSHTAIGTADYLIAATADVKGAELATMNVKHFPMFKGLRTPF